MPRSKLEINIDILKVLANKGPLILTHVTYATSLNYNVVKEYLGFLVKQGLAEAQNVSKQRVVYLATEKGLKVLEYLRELRQVLPIVEEAQDNTPSID